MVPKRDFIPSAGSVRGIILVVAVLMVYVKDTKTSKVKEKMKLKKQASMESSRKNES